MTNTDKKNFNATIGNTMLSAVEWREIVDFTDYEVSNFGEVRVLDKWINAKLGSKKLVKGRILKFKKSKDGSLRVGLVSNKKQYFLFAHKLVALSFIPNPERKDCVVHIDGNNQNNKVENLMWATWEEVREIAKLSSRLSGKIYQLNNHRSKKVMKIKDGKTEIFNSLSEVKRKENHKSHRVTHVITGRYEKSSGAEWLEIQ